MKVLIADDDPISRLVVERSLKKWGYDVVSVSDGNAAHQALLADDTPRLAVLDWMMPGFTGPELCHEVRQRVGRPYTYLLLVTSREGKEDVISGLNAGADDYLTKPVHPEELHARLRVGVRILELEDKLVAAQEVLLHKATHDSLTGLLNRAAIMDLLRRELARAPRENSCCGVVLADLDHFKAVNDSRGHAAGDEVLRESAQRLTAAVRGYDAVGRYGGEEFLLVLPGCDATALRDRAEHILAAFRDRSFEAAGETLRVTVSMGAASSADWPEATPDSLVRCADGSLYRAKRSGRDRTEIAKREEVHEPAEARLVTLK
ncbi:MAG: diguanylate cyclase [Candidatus Acidiferrales bacterium]